MAVLVSLAAVLSTLVGGFVAIAVRDRRHLVLGFAAGIMLGVVLFDLVPEALALQPHELGNVPLPLLTAALGFLTIHVVERALVLHRGHEDEYGGHVHAGASAGTERIGIFAGSALVLHSLLDGIGIGLAFQANTQIGVAVAIAVVAHDFADGFNTFTVTSLYGNSHRRALTLLVLDALAPLVGAAAASAVHVPPNILGLYLGFFAGFLLYLATADILPEAHATHPSRATLLCTAAGLCFMWAVIAAAQ